MTCLAPASFTHTHTPAPAGVHSATLHSARLHPVGGVDSSPQVLYLQGTCVMVISTPPRRHRLWVLQGGRLVPLQAASVPLAQRYGHAGSVWLSRGARGYADAPARNCWGTVSHCWGTVS